MQNFPSLSSSDYPIVFIHSGISPYMAYTLAQAHKSNPELPVCLIGDGSNNVFSSAIKHFMAQDFNSYNDSFAQIYKHISTNSYDFEFACILRWFVLLDFMEKNQLSACFYSDSDIMIYGNISQIRRSLPVCALLSCCGISAHTNFVQIEGLRLYCDLVMESYTKPEKWAAISQKGQDYMRTQGGGISDMSFFVLFKENYPDLIHDLSLLDSNQNSIFDIQLDYHQGLQTHDGIKKIVFDQAQKPIGYLLDGTAIKLHTLHFQGKNKRYFKKFYGFNLRYNYLVLLVYKQKIFLKLSQYL